MRSLPALLTLGLALASPALRADARTELLASYDKMLEARAYRFTQKIESGKQSFTQEGAVILPDRFHVKSPHGEFIATPEAVWMNAGGQWTRMPIGTEALRKQFSADAIADLKQSIYEVEDLGEREIEGRATRAYRYRSEGQAMGIKAKSEGVTYVELASGLPIRTEIDSEAMGRKTRSVQDLTWSDDVVIDAPR